MDELCKAGEDDATLADDLAQGLADKLNRIKGIDAAQASVITTAINQGNWPSKQQKMLAGAVRAKLLASASAASAGVGATRDNQDAAIELFARESDWAKLDDASLPAASKMIVLRDLLAALDITLPSEQMKARMANLLRYRSGPPGAAADWSPDEWQQFLGRCKKKWEPLRNSKLHGPFLAPYPLSPQELQVKSPATYAHAYAKEGPAPRACPELGDFESCRVTHSSVRKTDAARGRERHGPSLVLPAASDGGAPLTLTQAGVQAMFGTAAANAFQDACRSPPSWGDQGWSSSRWASQPWGGGGWVDHQWQKDNWHQPSPQLALPWVPPITANPATASQSGGAKDDRPSLELEDDEANLRAALEDRKRKADELKAEARRKKKLAKKRKAADGKEKDGHDSEEDGDEEGSEEEDDVEGDAEEDGMAKRPAAKAKGVAAAAKGGAKKATPKAVVKGLKRPAAASKWTLPIVPRVEEGDSSRTRNAFACKWLGRAVAASKAAGKTEAAVQEYKSKVYIKAGEVYDANFR